MTHNGASNRGQIIVRTQAIAQSNEVAKMRLRWSQVAETQGGCIGMCGERAFYVGEVHQEVPGTNNFARVASFPNQFNGPTVMLPERIFPLAQLCNADKQARIKFALANRQGREFYSVITSVSELESGKTTFQA